jgi:hypothetical protein
MILLVQNISSNVAPKVTVHVYPEPDEGSNVEGVEPSKGDRNDTNRR